MKALVWASRSAQLLGSLGFATVSPTPGLVCQILLTKARSDIGDLSHVVIRGYCYKCFCNGQTTLGPPVSTEAAAAER